MDGPCFLCKNSKPRATECNEDLHARLDEEKQRVIHKLSCLKLGKRDNRCKDDYIHDNIERPAGNGG